MEVSFIRNCITVVTLLVGVALFLSLLAEKKMTVSELKATYPKLLHEQKENSVNP
jgi:phosphomannomutase